MIHDLTIGHLDPAAIRDRQAIAVKPLDSTVVARSGRLPRPQGRGAGRLPRRPLARPGGRRKGEAFATRLHAETDCLVPDRRNGRIAEVDWTKARVPS
jgi:hypothetical protein